MNKSKLFSFVVRRPLGLVCCVWLLAVSVVRAQPLVTATPAVVEALGVPAQMAPSAERVDWRAVLRQAKAGDGNAQYRLATCYQTGRGCQRDLSRAVFWYRKAAEQGHGLAANNLALCYVQGVGGLPKDHDQAVAWLKRAVEAGEVAAETNLYVHYANGWGVLRDLDRAMVYLSSAAEKGDRTAQLELAQRLTQGDGLPQNRERARDWLEAAAENGDEVAPHLLGVSYESEDPAVAARWFRIAADRGNPAAMNALGHLIIKGAGVEKNTSEGVSWIQKAADSGDVAAKKRLAGWYRDGVILPQSHFHAVRLFREAGLMDDIDALDQASAVHQSDYPEARFFEDLYRWNLDRARRGILPAKLALAIQYRDGLGIDKNLGEAFFWLASAAEQGNAKAQYWLGLVYEEGQWVEKDLTQAVRWFHEAAKSSVAPARYKLGHAYAYGFGVDKDLKKAKQWLRLAASDYLPGAEDLLRKVESWQPYE